MCASRALKKECGFWCQVASDVKWALVKVLGYTWWSLWVSGTEGRNSRRYPGFQKRTKNTISRNTRHWTSSTAVFPIFHKRWWWRPPWCPISPILLKSSLSKSSYICHNKEYHWNVSLLQSYFWFNWLIITSSASLPQLEQKNLTTMRKSWHGWNPKKLKNLE